MGKCYLRTLYCTELSKNKANLYKSYAVFLGAGITIVIDMPDNIFILTSRLSKIVYVNPIFNFHNRFSTNLRWSKPGNNKTKLFMCNCIFLTELPLDSNETQGLFKVRVTCVDVIRVQT